METINNVVREMRSLGKLDEESTDKIPRSLQALGLLTYADRIEKAVTSCNQFKMRETVAETEKRIDKVISILTEIPDSCGYGGLLEDAADELCDLKEEFVKPALAAPPRNCDLYATEAEAYRGWERYYNSIDTKDGYLDFEDWLFAEAKGEAE